MDEIDAGEAQIDLRPALEPALAGLEQQVFEPVDQEAEVHQAHEARVALERVGVAEQLVGHPLVLGRLLEVHQAAAEVVHPQHARGLKTVQNLRRNVIGLLRAGLGEGAEALAGRKADLGVEGGELLQSPERVEASGEAGLHHPEAGGDNAEVAEHHRLVGHRLAGLGLEAPQVQRQGGVALGLGQGLEPAELGGQALGGPGVGGVGVELGEEGPERGERGEAGGLGCGADGRAGPRWGGLRSGGRRGGGRKAGEGGLQAQQVGVPLGAGLGRGRGAQVAAHHPLHRVEAHQGEVQQALVAKAPGAGRVQQVLDAVHERAHGLEAEHVRLALERVRLAHQLLGDAAVIGARLQEQDAAAELVEPVNADGLELGVDLGRNGAHGGLRAKRGRRRAAYRR